ncbi:Allinase, C-terminal [Cynara cardunculus var. scolymus]|uniref:Allinase, C-terminal n=1 Tax=Cynara cardunculus var. scolymus TaxID=59895 RepID=A0A118JSK6_CYNCS|nr:Allinase, C-terminal [Cynara cardunculus var. scolymus]
MYEAFWRKMGDKCTVVIKGYEHLSYFSTNKNPCWFLEPKLEDSIRSLHGAVGNAETDGYTIVVGTGSSQLLQAVLYALAPQDQPDPINVVSAAPFYSSYPETTNIVRSGVYKWAGDAHGFDKDEPYIEFVTSPNNPNGVIRGPVVNRDGGFVVYDLAYYWPQYTPITSSLDFDIMLFTASNSIGVSKESQLRVAKILQVVADGCKRFGSSDGDNLFEYGRNVLAKRWEILRETDGMEECEKVFKGVKILVRSGRRFGSDPGYARVSMMGKDEEFNGLIERLSSVIQICNNDD